MKKILLICFLFMLASTASAKYHGGCKIKQAWKDIEFVAVEGDDTVHIWKMYSIFKIEKYNFSKYDLSLKLDRSRAFCSEVECQKIDTYDYGTSEYQNFVQSLLKDIKKCSDGHSKEFMLGFLATISE